MRKAVLLILLVVFAIPVSALSVKNAVEFFFTDVTPAVVLGDQLNVDDILAGNVFMNEFGIKESTKASVADAGKTLVVIGGPCANPLWATLSPSDTCDGWDQPEHVALIVTVEKGSNVIVLIGGTTGKDTRAAAKHIVENFGEAVFNKDRVVLNVDGLPLANDQLIVYKPVGSVGEGQSSAKGDLIIEIENDAGEGTYDLVEALQKYIREGFPYATVTILEQDEVSLNLIANKIFVKFGDPALISVEKEAQSGHVVIAAAAAFWIGGQGIGVNADTTHNQLIQEDLEFG